MKLNRLIQTMLGAALVLALVLPASAQAADRNNDSIPDRWERAHGLSLKKNQAGRDQDRDQLRNRDEYRARFDPRNADTDGDGLEDGDEGAGVITSFDEESGVLRIDVFNGSTFSGVVTEWTKIGCEGKEDEKPPKEEEPPPKEEEPAPPPKEGPATARNDELDEVEPDKDDGETDVGEEKGEDDEAEEPQCSTADLVPGAIVQGAQLYLEDGEAFWKAVELRR